MKISEILTRKGSKVETVTPQTTLLQANAQMARLVIGAMVVHDIRQGYLGVLAERDILRRLAAGGPSALNEPVSEALTGQPITCSPEDDVHSVMETMTQRRIRHVPVVVDKELVGIVSIGDIVKQMLDEARLEVGVLRDYARSH